MMTIKTKPRDFAYNERVAEWRERVEVLRDVAGVSSDQVPTEVILSLIHVESSGNDAPKNDGESSYVGLLQIGASVTADVNNVWGTNYRKSDFSGNGSLSIEAFYAWAKRYQGFHDWDPELIAIGWKGGVGTLDGYRKRLSRGESLEDVYRWLEEDRWNSYSYLVWFRKALDVWGEEGSCG
jgi:hypothetical protein